MASPARKTVAPAVATATVPAAMERDTSPFSAEPNFRSSCQQRGPLCSARWHPRATGTAFACLSSFGATGRVVLGEDAVHGGDRRTLALVGELWHVAEATARGFVRKPFCERL